MSPYCEATKRKLAAIKFMTSWPTPKPRFVNAEARKQAALRQRLQPIFDSPPSIVLLERISIQCPRCRASETYFARPGNRVQCLKCSQEMRVDCWLLARKSGQPRRMFEAAFGEAPQIACGRDGEMARIESDSVFLNLYLIVWRGAWQCPTCGHVNRLRFSARNSYQCGRCRRHWEMLILVKCLRLAPSS